MKSLKSRLLAWLLKGTWHICNHEFEVKMVALSGKYTEQMCKKCGVNATTQYADRLLILVKPETNHPYKLDPWGIATKPVLGVNPPTNITSE